MQPVHKYNNNDWQRNADVFDLDTMWFYDDGGSDVKTWSLVGGGHDERTPTRPLARRSDGGLCRRKLRQARLRHDAWIRRRNSRLNREAAEGV